MDSCWGLELPTPSNLEVPAKLGRHDEETWQQAAATSFQEVEKLFERALYAFLADLDDPVFLHTWLALVRPLYECPPSVAEGCGRSRPDRELSVVSFSTSPLQPCPPPRPLRVANDDIAQHPFQPIIFALKPVDLVKFKFKFFSVFYQYKKVRVVSCRLSV